MPRPTKFTPEIGESVLRHLASGRSRRETVEALGIGRRTLQDWLRRGRAGEPGLAAWAERVDRVATLMHRQRVRATWDRLEAESKERWMRFKRAREEYWMERLGPLEFWSRRLAWLAERGRWEAYRRTLERLRTEGFRTDCTP
ncbi:helix-turn-helix domain-containing protein [Tautonia plasticadhaerens]|uniref:Insertion element IS150 protein InsJ-like helix-turn-helix domain-containing protein n=1 Tax=Tautonia plasticadhaerens TaxID=2527974 RepID=A0A518H0M7_9BACT|nr:helix-turn-helix domain-containing protein [Tautonia plasticadhaerens]QDV34405.1 hypothetical protein ElP_22910 [Tautonia plasticadhaerens]